LREKDQEFDLFREKHEQISKDATAKYDKIWQEEKQKISLMEKENERISFQLDFQL
jgi:hypothetical protein